MLELIIMVILLLAIGVPVAKSLGFLINPFWAFTNYSRIKNNESRVSDFYNTTQQKVSEDFTTSLHLKEIPKPTINFELTNKEKPK